MQKCFVERHGDSFNLACDCWSAFGEAANGNLKDDYVVLTKRRIQNTVRRSGTGEIQLWDT